jgi:hypothetical protein
MRAAVCLSFLTEKLLCNWIYECVEMQECAELERACRDVEVSEFSQHVCKVQNEMKLILYLLCAECNSQP